MFVKCSEPICSCYRHTPEYKAKLSLAGKGRKQTIEHIRKRSHKPGEWHHSLETRKLMSRIRMGKSAWNKGLTKETDPRVLKYSHPKPPDFGLKLSNLYTIGGRTPNHGKRIVYKGILFRSSWEVKVVEAFDRLGILWEYEKKRFKVFVDGKLVTYIPDFYLPKYNVFVEVKGYWRGNFNKWEAFLSQYNKERILLIQREEMRHLEDYIHKNILR